MHGRGNEFANLSRVHMQNPIFSLRCEMCEELRSCGKGGGVHGGDGGSESAASDPAVPRGHGKSLEKQKSIVGYFGADAAHSFRPGPSHTAEPDPPSALDAESLGVPESMLEGACASGAEAPFGEATGEGFPEGFGGESGAGSWKRGREDQVEEGGLWECERCGKLVEEGGRLEHEDYHVAFELQQSERGEVGGAPLGKLGTARPGKRQKGPGKAHPGTIAAFMRKV